MSTPLKTLDVLLDKKDIYTYITTLTGNIGKRQKAYEQFCCTSDNYAVLDHFADSAVAFIEAHLHRFVSSTYDSSLKLNANNITLHLSEQRKDMSFSDELQGNIATLLRLAFAYNLTGMWIMGINADAALTYTNLFHEALNRLTKAIVSGSVVSTTFSTAKTDSESVPGSSVPSSTYVTAKTDSESVPGSSVPSSTYVTAKTDTQGIAESSTSTITFTEANEDKEPIKPFFRPDTLDGDDDDAVIVDDDGTIILATGDYTDVIDY